MISTLDDPAVTTNPDVRSADAILAEPMSPLRLRLAKIIRSQHDPSPQGHIEFGRKEVESFWNEVQQISTSPETLSEMANARQAIQTGVPYQVPNLETPTNQLIWAAALTHLHVNPKNMGTWPEHLQAQTLGQTQLWKTMLDSPRARAEKVQYAILISSASSNSSARLDWGPPESWFYFDPQNNRVNMDLLFGLVGGFEHTRAIMMHEIGHSQLTTSFPKHMQKLHEQMEELKKKAEGRELKKEEYTQMARLGMEWQLYARFFNAGEDNCVNRFTARMGEKSPQDYGVSINYAKVILCGIGDRMMAERNGEKIATGASQAEIDFQNLCHAIDMSFFSHNGLFDPQKNGWEHVGVNRKAIEDAQKQAGGKAVEQLAQYLDGVKPAGVGYLQPEYQLTRFQRALGMLFFRSSAEDLCEKRCEVMEKVWDVYAKPIVDKLLDQSEQQLNQMMQGMMKSRQQGQGKGQQQNQQGQQGQGQPQQSSGSNGEGTPSPAQGMPQPSPGAGGNGKDDKGEKKDQDKSAVGQGDKDKKEEDKKDSKDEKGGGGKDEKDEKEKQGGGGKDQKEDKADSDKGDKKEPDTVPVEGVGDMPNVKTPPKTPKDVRPDESKGDPKDHKEQADQNQSQSIKDIIENSENQDRQQDEARDDMQIQKARIGQQANPAYGHGFQKTWSIDELPLGDWSDYTRRVRELEGPISYVQRMLKKIQEQQLQTKMVPGGPKSLLPEDGDFSRFSVGSYKDFLIKKALGQKIEREDFEHFHTDKEKSKSTEIDLFMWIDGSGSMNGNRLLRAIQTSIIFYEASKRVGINSHVGIWGNSNPLILAKPGDTPIKIGQAIIGAIGGLNSETQMAPAIVSTAGVLSQRKQDPGKMVGYSHVLFLSDGDIQDSTAAKGRLEDLFNYCQPVTVDVAIIGGSKGNAMEQTVESVSPKNPRQKVNVTYTPENRWGTSVVNSLLQKIRTYKAVRAVSAGDKQNQFQRAYKQMQNKRGGR